MNYILYFTFLSSYLCIQIVILNGKFFKNLKKNFNKSVTKISQGKIRRQSRMTIMTINVLTRYRIVAYYLSCIQSIYLLRGWREIFAELSIAGNDLRETR